MRSKLKLSSIKDRGQTNHVRVWGGVRELSLTSDLQFLFYFNKMKISSV